MKSHLHHEGFGGGSAADEGLGDVVSLGSSLVVKHRPGNRGRSGKLNYPVSIEVVLPAQVLDSCTEEAVRM